MSWQRQNEGALLAALANYEKHEHGAPEELFARIADDQSSAWLWAMFAFSVSRSAKTQRSANECYERVVSKTDCPQQARLETLRREEEERAFLDSAPSRWPSVDSYKRRVLAAYRSAPDGATPELTAKMSGLELK